MAKVQIKSEKLTPFGGFFSIMEQFDALLAQTIDSTLGLRCTMFGYQYSEILRSLMCVYLCGGSCIEDVTTHLMKHLSLHPTLRTCSADTILRAIEELTFKSITYKSASGKSYDFNTADKMNCLLVNALLATGQLKSGQEYDFDFDHQFIVMKKLLIIYLIISFLMVFVYAIFVVNAYVSIKYEVETIDNDAIINMVYQIFDTGVTVNFIWFAINTIIILGLYIKLRRK